MVSNFQWVNFKLEDNYLLKDITSRCTGDIVPNKSGNCGNNLGYFFFSAEVLLEYVFWFKNN